MRLTLQRFIHDKSPIRFKEFKEFQEIWSGLVVRRCESLRQIVRIPEMELIEMIFHLSCLRDNGVVYISDQGEPFWTMLLGDAFEKLFKIRNIGTAIDKILSEVRRDSPVDELLGCIWNTRELPSSWQDQLDAERNEEFKVITITYLPVV
jgi:hypothetical protein